MPDHTDQLPEGEALLQQLRSEVKPLPQKTVVAMVLGALKVRLMRSTVTMSAIVLAIAFLSYTGLTNNLVRNLVVAVTELEVEAEKAGASPQLREEVTELRGHLRRAGVNVESTLAGNPLDTWLIIMAMITCTVGIANAMLMSVTERFREIATMKCLGALDSLVIKMFLLESSFLGMVGAVAGIVIGTLVALGAAALQFGKFGIDFFPFVQGVSVIFWCLLAGMILSVAGAVYPAILAARMKPVDALRVDE